MKKKSQKLTMETTAQGKRVTVRRGTADVFELQCYDPVDYPEETDLGDELEWFIWSFTMNGIIPPRRRGYKNRTDIDALADACEWFGLSLDDIDLAPQFAARMNTLKTAMNKP